ncbi:hypothetical protein C0993_011616 [Termitomyces sp. T159_Od127]|nr:hypothetical protein C0993_011616 [Termitomyces sp. T159_Od127]
MSSAMWRIYRRMVLDQARIRLLDLTGINSEDFNSSGLLEEAVEARLPKNFALKKSALDMIFKTGSVRQQGNTAAHEGPPEAIALAILGSDLSNSDRTTLAVVYKYVYGVEPALE